MGEEPMRTVRSTISTAVNKWIGKGDNILGRCESIKLVHFNERPMPMRLDSWPTPQGCNPNDIITQIEEAARNDAANCGKESIIETYGIVPYYEKGGEGGLVRFQIDAVISDNADGEGSGVGSYTEGANDRGQRHQGMRHIEALARLYVDGMSRLETSRESYMARLLIENAALAKANSDMRGEVEEAKDRKVEREIAVYKTYEEEKRTTALYEGLIPAAMMVANAALGRPIFPVSSDDNTVNMFKTWIRSITVEQMETFSKTLDPQQYMPLATAKQQIMDEDDAKEKKAQAEAAKAVGNVINDQGARDMIVKRDNAGVPREPLGGV